MGIDGTIAFFALVSCWLFGSFLAFKSGKEVLRQNPDATTAANVVALIISSVLMGPIYFMAFVCLLFIEAWRALK